MNWPAFCSRKYLRAAFVTIIVPKRFVSICARNSDRGVSSTDERLPYPALLMTTSNEPNTSTAAITAFAAAPASVTSIAKSLTGSPYRSDRSASDLMSRAVANTLLPAARPASTIARPRPRELPVTNHICAIHPPLSSHPRIFWRSFSNSGLDAQRHYRASATFSIQAKALFRRRDRRGSAIDEGVEHSDTAVAFLQNVRTGIAERFVRRSAPPTAHPDIMHRANIANHLVAVLRDALTNFRRCLIDRRNADQAATRVYPYAIFRISIAHHGFALHWIKLDEDLIEIVAHQFCSCHLLLLVFSLPV